MDDDPSRREARVSQRHARTKTTNSQSSQASCVVCGERGRSKKLYYCRKFKTLQVAEKKEAVKRVGACGRCLEVHNDGAECKTTFLCKNEGCKDTQGPGHHYYLCPKAGSKGDGPRRPKPSLERGGWKKCTEIQEEFLTSLPPELAQRCRNVFCNSVAKTFSSSMPESRLLAQNGLKEFPVIMMILEVTANAGQKIGTLIDLASDTNYITHEAAGELNLRSEDVTLIVHGVGGMQVTVETKRYLLKIWVMTSRGTLRSHQLVCWTALRRSIGMCHRRFCKTYSPASLFMNWSAPGKSSCSSAIKKANSSLRRCAPLVTLSCGTAPLGRQ